MMSLIGSVQKPGPSGSEADPIYKSTPAFTNGLGSITMSVNLIRPILCHGD